MLKKFNWGHGVVVALASFILFILYLIFIYSHGQQTSELIEDNYYERELAYQEVIDAKNKADQLVEKPVYSQKADGIHIKFPSEFDNTNTKFTIDLLRIENPELDIKREITLNNDNEVFIPSKVLAKGNYVLRMKWKKGKDEYQMDYNLIW